MLKSDLEVERNKRLNTTLDLQIWKSTELNHQNGIYIYDIAADNEFQLASSFSNHFIKVFDPENLHVKYSWKAHNKKISGLKFNPVSQNQLLSSSLEGSVCLWDLRCSLKNPALKFEETSKEIKPMTCFDIDFSGDYVCAGTELIHQDSYILFWDCRKTEILGGYWNSHFDEITQVKFHSSRQNWMISGSIDGLINLFDISKSCEDDALVTTFNAESSIFKLHWLFESNKLACITNNQDLQIWNINNTSPSQNFNREKLSNYQNGMNFSVDYLIDIIQVDSSVQLMAGSYSGTNSLLELHEDNCHPLAVMQGNENEIIRACIWNNMNNSLITGGEDGEILIWKTKDITNSIIEQQTEVKKLNIEKEDETLPSDSLKVPSSLKKQLKDIKPYGIKPL